MENSLAAGATASHRKPTLTRLINDKLSVRTSVVPPECRMSRAFRLSFREKSAIQKLGDLSRETALTSRALKIAL